MIICVREGLVHNLETMIYVILSMFASNND